MTFFAGSSATITCLCVVADPSLTTLGFKEVPRGTFSSLPRRPRWRLPALPRARIASGLAPSRALLLLGRHPPVGDCRRHCTRIRAQRLTCRNPAHSKPGSGEIRHLMRLIYKEVAMGVR